MLPRPFAHEGPVSENALIELPSSEGVRVILAPALPPDVAQPVVAAAVKTLVDGGIPASGEAALSRSYVLRGDVVVDEPADGGPETAEVRWKLLDPSGQPVGKIDQRVDGKDAGWSGRDPAPLEGAARDAGREVLAYFERRMQPATIDGTTEAAVPLPRRLFISGVTGAPGDGNESLKRALAFILRRSGAPLADSSEDASHVLSGRVEATPKGDGMSDVSVEWRLAERGGEEIGTISQRNPVKTALIERRWGELAYVVSDAAADGVLDAFAAVGNGPERAPAPPPGR